MGNEVDYYDVQAMIRDARSEIRGEIREEVEQLRRDMYAALDELREWVTSVERVLSSRTDHLV